VNALANDRVAELVNEHFVATYLKVGTFQIINGQKVGGNVASYFCLPDGAVVHAIAGPVDAQVFLREARWALETRKSALTLSTRLATGEVDQDKYRTLIQQAHEERYQAEQGMPRVRHGKAVPKQGMNGALARQPPRGVSQPAQVHWLLATSPLPPIEELYPIVWEQILRERLSGLPVAQR
jgi:hypothetical protein